jgi:hypothetical protein
VGNNNDIGHIQTAGFQERQSIADYGADIGLQPIAPITGIDSRRSPNLNRKNAEGAKEGPGVVDGKDGGYRPSIFLIRSDAFHTPGNALNLVDHQMLFASINLYIDMIGFIGSLQLRHAAS